MKKFLLSITFIFLLLGILVSCSTPSSSKEVDELDNSLNNMSYQLVSSIQMMEINSQTASIRKLSKKTVQNSEEVLEKEDIDQYIKMMNELLDNNGGLNCTETPSDKAEYQHLVIVTTNTIQNETTTYYLYYNEIETKTNQEEDETETSTKIEGIAVTADMTYLLEGLIESEQEEDETETETYFKIIEDKENYVIVKEEIEQEQNEFEHSFKYEVVVNKERIKSLSLKVEKENNETSIKLTDHSNEKISYKFNIEEENGLKYVKVKVENGSDQKDIHVRIVYDMETGTYKYDYKYAGSNSDKTVNNKDDQKNDEEKDNKF